MRGYNLVLLMLLFMPLIVHSEYWFQYGARSGTESYFNTGAKVTIQTISNQTISSGSMAYWVGENLANGAFLQVGYLIPNRSGMYPSFCDGSGCSQKTYLSAYSPEWFYEYFNSVSGTSFLGAVGPNDSAGSNNSTHTYGFYSKGNLWYFFMDNTTLGTVDLGTNNSGSNGPVAFAEMANTSTASNLANPVIFSNLSVVQFGNYLPVPQGYSYIGYGVGSASKLANPYSVMEVGSKVNYFEAGSNLPKLINGQELWKLGFNLDVQSQYGNISGTNQYLGYHSILLYTPNVLYLNPNSRAVFVQWNGSGIGSYSGTSPAHNLILFGNITEIANWNLQYLFNLTSQYGRTQGGGWYNSNSLVNYSINSSYIYLNRTERWNFEKWSNGNPSISSSLILSSPYSLYAIWQKQFLLNASSQIGVVSGAGWYVQNSTAVLNIENAYLNISNTKRQAFYSWSNGDRNLQINVSMDLPVSLTAIFKNQSLVHFEGTDYYGNPVQVTYFNLSNTPISGSAFVFDYYNYNLSKAYYKGTTLLINKTINITSPANLTFNLPIYNAQISTTDIFGIPVNVPINIDFLNGSTYNGYSGQTGSISIPDVPYGSVSVAVHYYGITINSHASGGARAKIIIVSALDILIFAAILLVSFLIYLFASHWIGHPN